MYVRIYGINDKIRNRIVYVGKTTKENDYNPHSKRMLKIIRNDTARYEYVILEQISDINILNDKEVFYIEKYNTFKDDTCFNYTKGGTGGYTTSKLSEKERKEIKQKELQTKLNNPSIMRNAVKRAKETFSKRPIKEQQQMHRARIDASIKARLANLEKMTDEEKKERKRLHSERVKKIHSQRDDETRRIIAEKIRNTAIKTSITLENLETGELKSLSYVQWKRQHKVNVSVLKHGIQKKTHGWKLPTHVSF